MTDDRKHRVLGSDSPDEYVYVGHGVDVVLLCESGDLPRYKNAICLTPDEAEKLGRDLVRQARLAREVEREPVVMRRISPGFDTTREAYEWAEEQARQKQTGGDS